MIRRPIPNTHHTITTDTAGIFGTGAVARTTGTAAALRREVGRWRWPLPAGSVLPVVDDSVSVPDVMGALADAGISGGDVWIASGEAGAGRLREAYARRGALSRRASLLDDEHEVIARLEAWCARGARVMLVRAPCGGTGEVAAAVVR